MRQCGAIVLVESRDQILNFVQFNVAAEIVIGIGILFDCVEMFDILSVVACQRKREVTKTTELRMSYLLSRKNSI
jgi:hypothetical protein